MTDYASFVLSIAFFSGREPELVEKPTKKGRETKTYLKLSLSRLNAAGFEDYELLFLPRSVLGGVAVGGALADGQSFVMEQQNVLQGDGRGVGLYVSEKSGEKPCKAAVVTVVVCRGRDDEGRDRRPMVHSLAFAAIGQAGLQLHNARKIHAALMNGANLAEYLSETLERV